MENGRRNRPMVPVRQAQKPPKKKTKTRIKPSKGFTVTFCAVYLKGYLATKRVAPMFAFDEIIPVFFPLSKCTF